MKTGFRRLINRAVNNIFYNPKDALAANEKLQEEAKKYEELDKKFVEGGITPKERRQHAAIGSSINANPYYQDLSDFYPKPQPQGHGEEQPQVSVSNVAAGNKKLQKLGIGDGQVMPAGPQVPQETQSVKNQDFLKEHKKPITISEGKETYAYHFPAKEGQETVVFFHANTVTADQTFLQHVQQARQAGKGIICLEYFSYTRDGIAEGRPSEESISQDITGLITYLKENNIDHVTIAGASLGAAAAIEMAHQCQKRGSGVTCDALVLDSPFTNAQEAVDSNLKKYIPVKALRTLLTDAVEDRWNNAVMVRTLKDIPIVTLSPQTDTIVPISQHEGIVRSAKEWRKEKNGEPEDFDKGTVRLVKYDGGHASAGAEGIWGEGLTQVNEIREERLAAKDKELDALEARVRQQERKLRKEQVEVKDRELRAMEERLNAQEEKLNKQEQAWLRGATGKTRPSRPAPKPPSAQGVEFGDDEAGRDAAREREEMHDRIAHRASMSEEEKAKYRDERDALLRKQVLAEERRESKENWGGISGRTIVIPPLPEHGSNVVDAEDLVIPGGKGAEENEAPTEKTPRWRPSRKPPLPPVSQAEGNAVAEAAPQRPKRPKNVGDAPKGFRPEQVAEILREAKEANSINQRPPLPPIPQAAENVVAPLQGGANEKRRKPTWAEKGKDKENASGEEKSQGKEGKGRSYEESLRQAFEGKPLEAKALSEVLDGFYKAPKGEALVGTQALADELRDQQKAVVNQVTKVPGLIKSIDGLVEQLTAAIPNTMNQIGIVYSEKRDDQGAKTRERVGFYQPFPVEFGVRTKSGLKEGGEKGQDVIIGAEKGMQAFTEQTEAIAPILLKSPDQVKGIAEHYIEKDWASLSENDVTQLFANDSFRQELGVLAREKFETVKAFAHSPYGRVWKENAPEKALSVCQGGVEIGVEGVAHDVEELEFLVVAKQKGLKENANLQQEAKKAVQPLQKALNKAASEPHIKKNKFGSVSKFFSTLPGRGKPKEEESRLEQSGEGEYTGQERRQEENKAVRDGVDKGWFSKLSVRGRNLFGSHHRNEIDKPAPTPNNDKSPNGSGKGVGY